MDNKVNNTVSKRLLRRIYVSLKEYDILDNISEEDFISSKDYFIVKKRNDLEKSYEYVCDVKGNVDFDSKDEIQELISVYDIQKLLSIVCSFLERDISLNEYKKLSEIEKKELIDIYVDRQKKEKNRKLYKIYKEMNKDRGNLLDENSFNSKESQETKDKNKAAQQIYDSAFALIKNNKEKVYNIYGYDVIENTGMLSDEYLNAIIAKIKKQYSIKIQEQPPMEEYFLMTDEEFEEWLVNRQRENKKVIESVQNHEEKQKKSKKKRGSIFGNVQEKANITIKTMGRKSLLRNVVVSQDYINSNPKLFKKNDELEKMLNERKEENDMSAKRTSKK